jgi:hypothetical protein
VVGAGPTSLGGHRQELVFQWMGQVFTHGFVFSSRRGFRKLLCVHVPVCANFKGRALLSQNDLVPVAPNDNQNCFREMLMNPNRAMQNKAGVNA